MRPGLHYCLFRVQPHEHYHVQLAPRILHHWRAKYTLEAFMEKAKAATGRNKKAAAEHTDPHAHVQDWKRPRECQMVPEMFETSKLAATASEQLSAAPVVQRCFALAVPLDGRLLL